MRNVSKNTVIKISSQDKLYAIFVDYREEMNILADFVRKLQDDEPK